MTVIGLTGLARAGKSTVAQILVEDHGFTRVSFAAPLKRMVRTLDPIITTDGQRLSDIWELHRGDEAHIKKWYPEYRRVLQVLGTDCIRSEWDDFWLLLAAQAVDGHGDFVFDDCRFPNEAQFIRGYNDSADGLWNIHRPDTDPAVDGHASEQHAGKLGETLWLGNDGTLDQLRHSVRMALEEMHRA
jgi:hypothetical protein